MQSLQRGTGSCVLTSDAPKMLFALLMDALRSPESCGDLALVLAAREDFLDEFCNSYRAVLQAQFFTFTCFKALIMSFIVSVPTCKCSSSF